MDQKKEPLPPGEVSPLPIYLVIYIPINVSYIVALRARQAHPTSIRKATAPRLTWTAGQCLCTSKLSHRLPVLYFYILMKSRNESTSTRATSLSPPRTRKPTTAPSKQAPCTLSAREFHTHTFPSLMRLIKARLLRLQRARSPRIGLSICRRSSEWEGYIKRAMGLHGVLLV